jgi:hypothetical protein
MFRVVQQGGYCACQSARNSSSSMVGTPVARLPAFSETFAKPKSKIFA